jgi:hypothetical protein
MVPDVRKRCHGEQRTRQQQGGGEAEAEGDAGSMRLRRSSAAAAYRSAAAMASPCAPSRPAISRSVWPATRSIVRARNASMPWARRRACLRPRRPAINGMPRPAASSQRPASRPNRGCMRPSAMLVPSAAVDGDTCRHEDPEIERVQRVDISGQTKEQPCRTAHQAPLPHPPSPAAKQPFAQRGEHAERRVVGRQPLAVARCRTADGEQADAGRGRKDIEGDAPLPWIFRRSRSR